MTVETNKSSAWTPLEEQTIAEIMEGRGCTRGNAIRVMRAGYKLGDDAAKKLRQPTELNEKLAELGVAAPHIAHVAKAKKVKVAKEPKPKKERKPAKSYKDLKAAGICVKCARYKAPKDGSVCLVCRAMAARYKEVGKKDWSRADFFKTNAAKEAIAASVEVSK
jgi:hypothetical protein